MWGGGVGESEVECATEWMQRKGCGADVGPTPDEYNTKAEYRFNQNE